MGEGEKARLVAWSRELRVVHYRLREALAVRETLHLLRQDHSMIAHLLAGLETVPVSAPRSGIGL